MKPFNTSENSVQKDLVPAGLHQAICWGLFDLGHQRMEWKGKEKWSRKVIFCWELPQLIVDFAKQGEEPMMLPRSMSRKFGNTLDARGHLRGALEGWRGKPFSKEELASFDMRKVLGAPCQLVVQHAISEHTGNEYASIQSILPWDKSQPIPTPVAELRSFTFADLEDGQDIGEFITTDEQFLAIPEWIRNIMAESKEVQEATSDNGQAFNQELATQEESGEDLEKNCPF